MPSTRAMERGMDECCAHYRRLVDDGCDESVAADRTFDAWACAFADDSHCFDKRDRLFESKVRTIFQEEQNA